MRRANGLLKGDGQVPQDIEKTYLNDPILRKAFEARSDSVNKSNSHLNWVTRGLDPNGPSIPGERDGYTKSHKLIYSTGENGEAFVFPSVIQQEDKSLKQLSTDEAWEHAKKTKSYIRFDNEKDAKEYSENGLIRHYRYGGKLIALLKI